MYKYAAVLLIIFFSITASGADSRTERWNLRIERLKKIQNEISSGNAGRSPVDGIISSEIRSSGEFLDILNRYKADDGTLKSETKKYPLSEIENKVREISLPAISLFYLSELYRNAGDMTVKEKIASEITQYSAQKFGSAVKISPAQGILISEYYILEKGISGFDSALKNSTAELLSRIEYELSRSDYNSNETDLAGLIRKQIEDYLPGIKFSDYSSFDEKYLVPVPQWKYITEQYLKAEERNRAVKNFVFARSASAENNNNAYDTDFAEKEIFDRAKEKISDMLQNTTPGSGATGSNPYYEIPDLKKLGAAIDEIDSYRKTLVQNISGSENPDLISRLKSNNAGIASKSIKRMELQFKNEETRIDRLKKGNGNIVIYNEELFKASKAHFNDIREEIYRYADLSAEFIDALYSSGKTDTGKYIEFHKYRSDRYTLYISFAEKLSENLSGLSASGSVKLHSLCKGTMTNVIASVKNLLKPDNIPAEIRGSLNRENLKAYAAINADYRTGAALIISRLRKNYETSIAGFSSAAESRKESMIESESRIGQDETDRLYSFAKKCSEELAAMNYTGTALKKYNAEYTRISEELKKGKMPEGLSDRNPPESFFAIVPGFSPETIDREIASREILAREGMEALSGSVTIVQYYKRKGFPVKITPSNEEIISMKRIFVESPEVTVSSWRMNGKNFRQIDVNVAAELKKLLNKNAWNSNPPVTQAEVLKIYGTDADISFTPPHGWKKISGQQDKKTDKISFESPDMKGVIEVTSICESGSNLQNLAGDWPRRSGFSMVEKNWGRKNNSDYIRSTAKNTYDGIMESYILAKKGYVVILSGKTTGDRYRQLSRTLGEMFTKLEIKEPSI